MGYGDELMALGEAQALSDAHEGARVAILDKFLRPRAHPLWRGCTEIATPDQVAAGTVRHAIINGSGARPYLRGHDDQRFYFVDRYQPKPARLRFSEAELHSAAPVVGGVLVEPNLKPKASPNKAWPWQRWQDLVSASPDIEWIQVGPSNTRLLDGVRHVVTTDFRAACVVLSQCDAAVLPDGGLHHAAAAVGVSAVVIFGSFCSPAITGYEEQISLYKAHYVDGSPCGRRFPCHACQERMESISPEQVREALGTVL